MMIIDINDDENQKLMHSVCTLSIHCRLRCECKRPKRGRNAANRSLYLAKILHQFHSGEEKTTHDVFVNEVNAFPTPADDGLIQQSDLREVMKACMEENGMRFDEKEIEDLAQALYEDAAGLAAGEAAQEADMAEAESKPRGISVEDLKAEMAKHEGLLENLSIKLVLCSFSVSITLIN